MQFQRRDKLRVCDGDRTFGEDGEAGADWFVAGTLEDRPHRQLVTVAGSEPYTGEEVVVDASGEPVNVGSDMLGEGAWLSQLEC